MEKFKFTPEQGFRDGTAFPNPTRGESEVRDQLQRPLDQIKNYINQMLELIPNKDMILDIVSKSFILTSYNDETGELTIGSEIEIDELWEAEY